MGEEEVKKVLEVTYSALGTVTVRVDVTHITAESREHAKAIVLEEMGVDPASCDCTVDLRATRVSE